MRRGEGRSLVEIITWAVEEARLRGQDRNDQFDRAVAAVMAAEPSLSHTAARRLVETLCS